MEETPCDGNERVRRDLLWAVPVWERTRGSGGNGVAWSEKIKAKGKELMSGGSDRGRKKNLMREPGAGLICFFFC